MIPKEEDIEQIERYLTQKAPTKRYERCETIRNEPFMVRVKHRVHRSLETFPEHSSLGGTVGNANTLCEGETARDFEEHRTKTNGKKVAFST